VWPAQRGGRQREPGGRASTKSWPRNWPRIDDYGQLFWATAGEVRSNKCRQSGTLRDSGGQGITVRKPFQDRCVKPLAASRLKLHPKNLTPNRWASSARPASGVRSCRSTAGPTRRNMRPLKDWPFKCSACGSREVALWLFTKRAEADTWADGDVLEQVRGCAGDGASVVRRGPAATGFAGRLTARFQSRRWQSPCLIDQAALFAPRLDFARLTEAGTHTSRLAAGAGQSAR
jgi:hypothetical protein